MNLKQTHCKKCDKPVYVYEPGLGSQKPYVSALCVDHIYEAFKALGVLPPFPEDTANAGGAEVNQKGDHHEN